MRRVSRLVAAVVALAALVAVAGCAGLPTSGPVNAGTTLDEDDRSRPDLAIIPAGPAVDATPEQIVEGFVLAGSGSRENWRIAREFLAPDFQTEWQPGRGVIVYTPGQRSPVRPGLDDTYVLTVASEATVDATGVYAIEPGREVTLSFRVAQQDDGQWRITEAPDGVVLDRPRFESVFGSYSLMFFDPTGEFLVPDVRWFPVGYAATSIAVALVDGGPSPLLQGAVETAFTDSARLDRPAVPERSGVAEVALQPGARELDQGVLNRMQTQLQASLATAGIQNVDMVVGGEILAASSVTTQPVRVDPRAMVYARGLFGFLSGDDIEPIADLSEAIQTSAPTAVEVDAATATAAVLDPAGAAARVTADGAAVLDDRGGLIAPTLDAQGWVWTVPASDPSAVIAFDADGDAHPIAAAWPGATSIQAMRVSRDGTRVAALVRDGAHTAVWVSSVQRDGDGAPVALGERTALDDLIGTGLALSWRGPSRVVALVADGEDASVVELPIGGPGTQSRAPGGAIAVAGGNQSGPVRVLTASGELFDQASGTWISRADEVAVLAIQRGIPG